MRIFVKYDSSGEILSVSRVFVMPAGINQPYQLSGDEFVLEVPAKGQFLKLDATEIHEQFEVNVDKKKLQKKA